MTDLPEPLTPTDCDLRRYPWMPLDVTRLLTSETWVLGTPEQKVACITLWAKSWHQVPAGSLPAHDSMLCHLSEAGSAWKRVRDHALRGWIKCSDGRLYHPVVCEKARESHELLLAQKARTEAARLAKQNKKVSAQGSDTPPAPPVTEVATTSVTEIATEVVTASTRPDQTRQEKKDNPLIAPPAPATAPAAKRGSRLNPDWQAAEAERRFATDLGYSVGEIASMEANFRDYWVAKPGAQACKLDWPATWRNWCRNQRKPGFCAPVRRQSTQSALEELAQDWHLDEPLPSPTHEPPERLL